MEVLLHIYYADGCEVKLNELILWFVETYPESNVEFTIMDTLLYSTARVSTKTGVALIKIFNDEENVNFSLTWVDDYSIYNVTNNKDLLSQFKEFGCFHIPPTKLSYFLD